MSSSIYSSSSKFTAKIANIYTNNDRSGNIPIIHTSEAKFPKFYSLNLSFHCLKNYISGCFDSKCSTHQAMCCWQSPSPALNSTKQSCQDSPRFTARKSNFCFQRTETKYSSSIYSGLNSKFTAK